MLVREKRDLEYKIKCLTDENLEISRNRQESLINNIQTERGYKTRISELSSVCKGLEGETSSLKTEILKLKQDLIQEKKEKDSHISKILEMNLELDKMKNLYSQRCHEYNIEVNQLKAISVKEKSKDDAILREEILKNSKLENIIANNQDVLKNLKQELIEKEHLVNEKIKEAREEGFEKISQLEFQKKDLEQEISRLNMKISDVENQNTLIKKDFENVITLI